MDQTEEIVRLLTEIRDNQRASLVENQRLYRDQEERQKSSVEETIRWYRKSVETSRSVSWAMYVLIAMSVAFNLAVLSQVAGRK